MASPDLLETYAPEGSFRLVEDINNQYPNGLGNERTRRRVNVYPVFSEDFTIDRYGPGPFRDGISMVWGEIDIINAANPKPGERFLVVALRDDPLYGGLQGFYRFVLSSAERVIGLSAHNLYGERESIVPPTVEELFEQIKIAVRLQSRLKTPG